MYTAPGSREFFIPFYYRYEEVPFSSIPIRNRFATLMLVCYSQFCGSRSVRKLPFSRGQLPYITFAGNLSPCRTLCGLAVSALTHIDVNVNVNISPDV